MHPTVYPHVSVIRAWLLTDRMYELAELQNVKPENVAYLVAAHELGHQWGLDHRPRDYRGDTLMRPVMDPTHGVYIPYVDGCEGRARRFGVRWVCD